MPSLRAELSVKLDASTLVQSFLTKIAGPAGALQGISDPLSAGQLDSIRQGAAGISLGGLGTSVRALGEQAASLVAGLPVGGNVIRPVTDALGALETLVKGSEVSALDARLRA